ncbi:AAA family ATPase [Methylogaea oryzae]|uniref:AAA family ATPase n=1 Tax=Methylogaea oryzae TaxID=1295382 RepID=UPI0006D00654|nr:AAA family ATPase [Methylogaea oryzae]
MLKLKKMLQEHEIMQAEVARAADVSPATIAQLLNHGQWPRTIDREELIARIRAHLEDKRQMVYSEDWFNEVADEGGNPHQPGADVLKENDDMIPKPCTTKRAALRHFKLATDPTVDPESDDGVFKSTDYQDVYEAMYQCARFGGYIAVIGESGAGKTTILQELVEECSAEESRITLVRPYVMGMEKDDKTGKTLKATHLVEAIMAAIAPDEKKKSSPQERFEQCHQTLIASANAGYSVCMVIDEAHAAPDILLKHLKRFRDEMRLGRRRLISIILIGQPPLRRKISLRNYNMIEAAQRIPEHTLPPLGENLEGYLRHIIARAGGNADTLFAPGAIEAIRNRLEKVAVGSSKGPRAKWRR